MKIKQTLAGVGVALAILGGGATACGTTGAGNGGYVDEVQYGYYDPGYAGNHAHYHYYDHPKQVHIPRSQYNARRYQYQPHGTQHRVTIRHTTTTTTTHHSSTGGKTTTRHTTTTKRTTTVHRSGSSYSRRTR